MPKFFNFFDENGGDQQNQCDMCIYRQIITMFISSIIGYHYIRHNYMFGLLVPANFRLQTDLSSSYTTDKTYVGCFFRCGEGVSVGPKSYLCKWWVHGLEQYHQFIHVLFLATYVQNGIHYIISLVIYGIYVLNTPRMLYLLYSYLISPCAT